MPENEKELFEAAKRGDLESMYKLGAIYFEGGDDVPKEQLTKRQGIGRALIKKAAGEKNGNGSIIAKHRTARFYINREKLEIINQKEAMDWLKDVAFAERSQAMIRSRAAIDLIFLYEMNGYNSESGSAFNDMLEMMQKLTSKNEPIAMVMLGTIYYGWHSVFFDTFNERIARELYNPKEGLRLIKEGVEIAESRGEDNPLKRTHYNDSYSAYQIETRKILGKDIEIHHYYGNESDPVRKDHAYLVECVKRKLAYAKAELDLLRKMEGVNSEYVSAVENIVEFAEKELKYLVDNT